MAIIDLDELEQCLIEKVAQNNASIQGPAATEYGCGWDPVITFWMGERRVHFYLEEPAMRVEVAELSALENAVPSHIRRGYIESIEDAWRVLDEFLVQNRNFESLSEFEWSIDSLDSDKIIPHPPNTFNPANLACFVSNQPILQRNVEDPLLVKWLQWTGMAFMIAILSSSLTCNPALPRHPTVWHPELIRK